VDVDQFVRFFSHPVRYLVRERLGIRLEAEEGLLETREPFALDPLAGYQLRQALLDGRLRARPAEEVRVAARAAGLLPHGTAGDVLLRLEAARVERFAARLEALRPTEASAALPVELDLGPIRLRGRLADAGPRGRFAFRLGSTRVSDRMALWIHHLLLNRLVTDAEMRESRWLGEDESLRLRPVADAEALLRRLADLYWRGLSRILPLLPNASYAYATAYHEQGDRNAALAAARKAWDENEYTGRGEETDPYHRLAFRGSDPLDREFAALAEEVFAPLLAHQEAV
jgi:exodeoxyribonuclease V gamma subunit